MFDFLKPKKKTSPLPTAMAEPERYKGRPLLIVLERYVLSCLGENDEETGAKMIAIVQRVWGGGDDWRGTVREQLHLGDEIDDAIRALWTKNLDIARQNGVELHPVQFAKMFVDSNFASLIGASDG